MQQLFENCLRMFALFARKIAMKIAITNVIKFVKRRTWHDKDRFYTCTSNLHVNVIPLYNCTHVKFLGQNNFQTDLGILSKTPNNQDLKFYGTYNIILLACCVTLCATIDIFSCKGLMFIQRNKKKLFCCGIAWAIVVTFNTNKNMGWFYPTFVKWI